MGYAYAEIAIISPPYDSNCDSYFDNQAQLLDPTWSDNNHSEAFAVLATYIVNYAAGRFNLTNGHTLVSDSSTENNLHCFTAPKVIETDNKHHLQNTALINGRLIGLKQEMPMFMNVNSSLCCYVLFPIQKQPITV
jgi:hypothetical protein